MTEQEEVQDDKKNCGNSDRIRRDLRCCPSRKGGEGWKIYHHLRGFINDNGGKDRESPGYGNIFS